VWYFANGNTSGKYREYVAVQNPNRGPIQVAVQFLTTHHGAFTVYRNMPPTSRTTVYVNQFVRKDAVGVTLTANGPIVANRTIFVRHGMTSKNGVTQPQRTWYFAGGPGGNARNWIAAINPLNRWSYVMMRTFGEFGAELGTAKGWLRPHARVGYLINRLDHRSNVSVLLTASSPVVAEQSTYVGRLYDASTDVFGVPFAAKSWVFATANTEQGDTDTLVLFNPNLVPIPVVVQFIAASGGVTERTYVIGPLQQRRVDVGSVEPNAQLGLVAASNDPFVGLNIFTFNNGLGAMASTGFHF
jgi:hypothetical protein